MSARAKSLTTAFAAAALLAAHAAEAQTPPTPPTWVGQRKTPRLREIIAVDKTGEPGWRYGEEDLAKDGIATFKQPEQAVDIRTAYAATDATRFWTRVYVSDPAAVESNITAYVFLDTDNNPATGGSSVATEINPKLVASDPPPNPPATGYEFVLELRGNGTLTQFWSWSDANKKFAATVLTPEQAIGEKGKDLDPIRLNGDTHGYLQGSINLTLVGLAEVCNANIFVRSVDEAPGGASDLDVGVASSCVFVDKNTDGVPDIIISVDACVSDDQCPGDGFCKSGKCVIGVTCLIDTDCKAADSVCSIDGFCVPKGGASCSDSASCKDLACVNKVCVACSLGGDDCGKGRRCASTGLCIEVDVSTASVGAGVGAGGGGEGGAGGGGALTPGKGDNVQGGACSCGVVGEDGESRALAILLGVSLPWVGLARRRRRASRAVGGCSR